jgi:hypothetical protein
LIDDVFVHQQRRLQLLGSADNAQQRSGRNQPAVLLFLNRTDRRRFGRIGKRFHRRRRNHDTGRVGQHRQSPMILLHDLQLLFQRRQSLTGFRQLLDRLLVTGEAAAIAGSATGGRVLDVQLVGGDRPRYRVRVLLGGERVRTVTVDAVTGEFRG